MMWIRGGGHAGVESDWEGKSTRGGAQKASPRTDMYSLRETVREIKIDKQTKASSIVLIALAQGPGETPTSELKARGTGKQNKNKNLYFLSVYCVPSTVQIR